MRYAQSQIFESKISLKCLAARQPKDINRIDSQDWRRSHMPEGGTTLVLLLIN
jgi:hypothetical protein